MSRLYNIIQQLDEADTNFQSNALVENLTVTGNLVVNGTETILNTQTLSINDPLITLHSSFSGNPTLDGGLEVVRGNSEKAKIIFDEEEDVWKVGTESDLLKIARVTNTGNSCITFFDNNANTLKTNLQIAIDNTNTRLGIGTTNPSSKLTLYSDQNEDVTLELKTYQRDRDCVLRMSSLYHNPADIDYSNIPSLSGKCYIQLNRAEIDGNPKRSWAIGLNDETDLENPQNQAIVFGYKLDAYATPSNVLKVVQIDYDGMVIGTSLLSRNKQAILHVRQTDTNFMALMVENQTNSSPTVINQNGNVGLGTASPSERLDVQGNTKISGSLTAQSLVSTTETLASNFSTCAGIPFSTARPAVSTSPIAGEIHAYGSISGTSLSRIADDGFMRISAGGGSNTAYKTYIDLSGSSSVSDRNVNIVFGTAGNERMRINDIGNIGIGTTTPSAKFHIVQSSTGDALRVDDQASDSTYFRITETGQAVFQQQVATSYENVIRVITAAEKNAIRLSVSSGGVGDISILDGNNNNGCVLAGSGSSFVLGNFGIGTTSPSAKLHINGTTPLDTTIIDNSGLALNGMHKELAFSGKGRLWYQGAGHIDDTNTQLFVLLSSDQGTGNTPVVHLSYDCLNARLYAGGTAYFSNSIGVGTTSVASSAILDLTSTSKGLLPPRMSNDNRNAISSPVEGLVIYNTSTRCVNIRDNASWKSLYSIALSQIYSTVNGTVILPSGYATRRLDFGTGQSLQIVGSSDFTNNGDQYSTWKYVGQNSLSTNFVKFTISFQYSSEAASQEITFQILKGGTFSTTTPTGGTTVVGSEKTFITDALTTYKPRSASMCCISSCLTNDVFSLVAFNNTSADKTLSVHKLTIIAEMIS